MSDKSSISLSYDEIIQVMKIYFQALYDADSKSLGSIFHPDARYVNMTEGDYMNFSVSEYLQIVSKRTPPSQQGAERTDQIISIETGANQMAFVKAKMSMMGRSYLDFLTLSRDDSGWRIMSKIFSYSPEQGVS